MPNAGGYGEDRRIEKAKRIHAKLVAKGLDPRSNGFSRAFYKAMRK